MPTHYLAFDLGAESGRAVLGTLDGGKLAIEVVHRFANRMVQFPGGWHWNLPGLWAEIKTGLGLAAKRAELRSVGVDTWGVDIGLLDAERYLVGLPFAYRDPRNFAALDAVTQRIPAARLYAETGIPAQFYNTIFQLFALRTHQPGWLQFADRALFMPDLISFLLSGEPTCELSIASTSGLLDPRTRGWHMDLMSELGIPPRLFHPPVASGTAVGPLAKFVQEECSCGPVQVTATCGHDTACAVAAVPASGSNWCYISSGTWSLMGVELDQPVLSEAARSAGFTNEIGVGGRIRFLRNIAGLWLLQQCKRQWEQAGDTRDYGAIVDEAAAHRAPVAVLDPDHPSFGPAGPMIPRLQKYAQASGQPVPQSVAELTVCCLQALALRYRSVVENLEQVTGRKIEVIHIVGGGGQNRLLNQMTADCCRRTVIVGPTEATAIGNVLVQAMACGELSSPEEIRAVVRRGTETQTYEPAAKADWSERYATFQRLCAAPPTV